MTTPQRLPKANPHLGLLALLCPLVPLAGCASTPETAEREQTAAETTTAAPDSTQPHTAPGFRKGGPRAVETIFSPLDWPSPTEARLATGAPGPAYWQNQADYEIDVELDADARSIHATARITYTNNSPHELPFIWFHLEQNMFHPSSKGARLVTPGSRFRGPEGFEGGVTIHGIRDVLVIPPDGEDPATDRPTTTATSLEASVHDTRARLDLPAPIEPNGGRLTYEIEWSYPIPDYGSDRTGIEDVEQGVVFQIAQWFPQIAKYDDVHGWNTLPYLGAGEFYTDYGVYTVRITVPRDHIVAATGMLTNPDEVLTETQIERLEAALAGDETRHVRTPEEVDDPDSRPDGDGPLTWEFEATDVRDFAWASSDAFIWDASGVDLGNQRVLVQSVYPKEALPVWEKSTEKLRFALKVNSEWYPYPYPQATNVNGRVRGMEYPMVLFCRQRESERGLYGLTQHEIAHNWFPMMVNTNERRYMWMDEGMASFMDYYSNLRRYPDRLPRRGHPRAFARQMLDEEQQPIVTKPDRLRPGRLGTLAYAKMSSGLVLLREGILGEERFDEAFRAYIERWKFKSPQPWDFFRTIEDVTGEDLAWFWRGWYYETGLLDQGVGGVKIDKEGDLAKITFHNYEELVMPLEYRLRFEDGTVEDHRLPVEAWYATNSRTVRHGLNGRRLVSVQIDPREIFPDVRPENHLWEAEAPDEEREPLARNVSRSGAGGGETGRR